MAIAERSAAENAQRIADALERLVAVRGALDRGYVRRWIVDMMGEADERVLRWDALVTRYAPA